MIKCKNDYKYYIERDRIALGQKRKRPRILIDEIWKFQRLLRKCEYYENCKHDVFSKIYKYFILYKFKKLNIKLGFSIPLNVFGPGLSIAHHGTIAVNNNSKIGENCRIHEGVTIGATDGNPNAAQIGNNVFIGSGAKIIGNIKIADGVAIGANSVVTRSIDECNITVAGVPAKKISDKGSKNFIISKQEES